MVTQFQAITLPSGEFYLIILDDGRLFLNLSPRIPDSWVELPIPFPPREDLTEDD
jgi:hypothetical protein